jgi:hypothetical protein
MGVLVTGCRLARVALRIFARAEFNGDDALYGFERWWKNTGRPGWQPVWSCRVWWLRSRWASRSHLGLVKTNSKMRDGWTIVRSVFRPGPGTRQGAFLRANVRIFQQGKNALDRLS